MNDFNLMVGALILLGTICVILLILLLQYWKMRYEQFSAYTETYKKLLEDQEKNEQKLENVQNKIEEKIGSGAEVRGWPTRHVNQKIETLQQKDNDVAAEKDVKVSKVAYQDAVIAFDNINRKFYQIRKYPKVAMQLMDVLYNGKVESQQKIDDLSDELQAFISNLQSDILMFNRNYRLSLLSYLRSMNKQWGDCVRFPKDMPFDDEWDEHLLGDKVQNGETITRVVELGFEFPDSQIVGRHKSKVL